VKGLYWNLGFKGCSSTEGLVLCGRTNGIILGCEKANKVQKREEITVRGNRSIATRRRETNKKRGGKIRQDEEEGWSWDTRLSPEGE